MTPENAKNRADRIVALDLPKQQLSDAIAAELRSVADECGWQMDAVNAYRQKVAWLRSVIRNTNERLSTTLAAEDEI